MGANGVSNPVPQSPMADNIVKKPVGWRLINFTSMVQPYSELRQIQQRDDPKPGWSAVQYDFERRLSRFGIKVSETSEKPADTRAVMDFDPRQTTIRSFADPTITTEHHPPLEALSIASFANSRKEPRLEVAERQLQQARTEAQIWKAKYEACEHDLRTSYRETMDWRLKYEDLYSAVVQGQELRPQELPERKEGTKSLG